MAFDIIIHPGKKKHKIQARSSPISKTENRPDTKIYLDRPIKYFLGSWDILAPVVDQGAKLEQITNTGPESGQGVLCKRHSDLAPVVHQGGTTEEVYLHVSAIARLPDMHNHALSGTVPAALVRMYLLCL